MNLLDDGAESGGLSLKINKDFAAKYDAKKRGEELSKRACICKRSLRRMC